MCPLRRSSTGARNSRIRGNSDYPIKELTMEGLFQHKILKKKSLNQIRKTRHRDRANLALHRQEAEQTFDNRYCTFLPFQCFKSDRRCNLKSCREILISTTHETVLKPPTNAISTASRNALNSAIKLQISHF